jgi:hypothetical protein
MKSDIVFIIDVTGMASSTTQAIAARVPNEHARHIAALAHRNGNTISAVLARIVADRLADDLPSEDHLELVTERTAVSPNVARARPIA